MDKGFELLDKIRHYQGTPQDLLDYVTMKAGGKEKAQPLYTQKERSYQGNKSDSKK